MGSIMPVGVSTVPATATFKGLNKAQGPVSGPGMPLTRDIEPVKTLGMPLGNEVPRMTGLGLPSNANSDERAANSGKVSAVQVMAAYVRGGQMAVPNPPIMKFLKWA